MTSAGIGILGIELTRVINSLLVIDSFSYMSVGKMSGDLKKPSNLPPQLCPPGRLEVSRISLALRDELRAPTPRRNNR
jgi:hypothetical protein